MTIYSAAIILLLVMDPLGNIPIFISVLSHVDEKKRKYVIVRESIFACITLIIFLLSGEIILSSLHISQPALGISGGIILFLIALKMIFPTENAAPERQMEEPFIVPLAIPLLAGPSALAMVLLFATQYSNQLYKWSAAIVLASSLSALILLFADRLRKWLGQKGLIAMERLMGMILTTIAVQMFLTGLETYFSAIAH